MVKGGKKIKATSSEVRSSCHDLEMCSRRETPQQGQYRNQSGSCVSKDEDRPPQIECEQIYTDLTAKVHKRLKVNQYDHISILRSNERAIFIDKFNLDH
ncbi:hypothetical protein ACTXT7_001760 [Hymenolepis weldensis]